MKKQILLGLAVFITATTILSCSLASEEKNEPIQISTKVVKTEKMLAFEAGLKTWFRSQNLDDTESKIAANTAIEIQAKTMLTEIGVSQSKIESKMQQADNTLVVFAIEQYSKKLSSMYNQKNN